MKNRLVVLIPIMLVIIIIIIVRRFLHPSGDIILPDDISADQRRDDIIYAYELWKDQYVGEIEGEPERYYVSYDEDGNTVSEAHGYGMLIMVTMEREFGINTKHYFDGMLYYAKDYPSDINPALMAWKQNRLDNGTMIVAKNGDVSSSATDGDMDIAYALLLADEIWGSDGEIDYKQEAVRIIDALMESTVNHHEWTLKLGDWVKDDDSWFGSASRTSDWMLGHLAIFYETTGDKRWKKVLNNKIDMITEIQENYSSKTGLLPEFVWKQNGKWVPVDSYFLEGERDSHYSYNACRVPWRLTAGYYETNNREVKSQIGKMNSWVMEIAQNNPSNIKAGFTLNGEELVSFSDMAFVAPFAASASIDGENQEWLNLLWNHMTEELGDNDSSKYYNDSIRLLVMLFLEVAGEE